MAFSTDAKSEIMRTPCEKQCCVRAELSAVFLLAGSISFKGFGRYQLSMSSENPAVARYCFTQTRRLANIKPEIQTVRSNQLGDHVRYRLELTEEDSMILLDKLGLLDPNAFLGIRRGPEENMEECCRVAWLRGAFLTTGWVNSPDKAYHLEFAVSDESYAQDIARFLRELEVRSGVSERKSQTVTYVKDFEGVSRTLALLGAFNAYMSFENMHIMKDLRNDVNRQLNCDNNNADKTVQAAETQMADIEYLRTHGGLDSLPQSLQEIIELRIENPEASMTELGQMLEPPIGKSGVNNRLRRISKIAAQRRGEK